MEIDLNLLRRRFSVTDNYYVLNSVAKTTRTPSGGGQNKIKV